MLVNQKMRQIRKEKKLKLSDLTDSTGMTVSTLSRYERGTIKFIPPEVVRRIAKALDTDYEVLTEGDQRYQDTVITKTRQTYKTTRQSETIQSEIDKELLYSFHQLNEEFQDIVLNLCTTMAGALKN